MIFSVQLKRKADQEENEAAESSEWTTSPGYAEAVSSPLLTPVSGKGGRVHGKSKAPKYNKAGPHTPMSNAGEYWPSDLYLSLLSFFMRKGLNSSCLLYELLHMFIHVKSSFTCIP